MSYDIKLADEAARAIEAGAVIRGVSTEQYLARFLQAWAERLSDEQPDPDQAWFWTPEWQAGECLAVVDRAEDRSTRYASDEDFLHALKEHIGDPTEARADDDS